MGKSKKNMPVAGDVADIDSTTASRSWFIIWNNAQETYSGEPSEVAEQALAAWVTDHPTRTGAVAYCISADGLHHLHMVLEDVNKPRFSSIKALYPKAHLEPTKGNKDQAEAYIQKQPPFDEKGEVVVHIARHGEIQGKQGARTDIAIIEELLEQGKTPAEIMRTSLAYRRYDKMIRADFFDRRKLETPLHRDISVYWHVGPSGAGKSYEVVKLAEIHGEEKIYFVSDYSSGFLDDYCAEPILFLDELRDQLDFAKLLVMLHPYRSQIYARYTHSRCLWSELHITSIFPPEDVYDLLAVESKKVDSYEQLRRRITYIVYHYIKGDEYCRYQIPMSEYETYKKLVDKVETEGQGVEYLLSLPPQEFDPLLECETPDTSRRKRKNGSLRAKVPMLRDVPNYWDVKLKKMKELRSYSDVGTLPNSEPPAE